MGNLDFRVIGGSELLCAFRFAGVGGQACHGLDDTRAAFRAACTAGVRVVVITQDLAAGIRDELVAWQRGGLCPLVVEIPPLSGPVAGQKTLVELIHAAVGIQV